MKGNQTRYYTSFDTDFSTSADQAFELPKNYCYVRNRFGARVLSAVIYAAALAFSALYCHLVLHLRIKGKTCFKGVNGGFYIYGNHTQPFGDVFIPALCAFPRRIYTLVSPANYGIPVIGKLLPYLGALPLVPTLGGYHALLSAMKTRLDAGHPVVIYPEAHVWEYYTGIRPFPTAAFAYPVKFGKPVFAMTATYKKSRLHRRPIMTVYLDGPFYGEGGTLKERESSLHAAVFGAMTARAKSSDFAFINYLPKE